MYNKYLQQHNPDVHMMSDFLLTARDSLQLSCSFPFLSSGLSRKRVKKSTGFNVGCSAWLEFLLYLLHWIPTASLPREEPLSMTSAQFFLKTRACLMTNNNLFSKSLRWDEWCNVFVCLFVCLSSMKMLPLSSWIFPSGLGSLVKMSYLSVFTSILPGMLLMNLSSLFLTRS